jgi:carbamoyl-phosphate synthase large subunit
MNKRNNILIAGIAGASLGSEIAKCLHLTNKYNIYGCDISDLAYGHFMPIFLKTFVAENENYVDSVISICEQNKINYIIPGGEIPMCILSQENFKLKKKNITLVSNSPTVIEVFSDKKRTFKKLKELGCNIPLTIEVQCKKDLDEIKFPCIVKPSSGSGGSDSVFLAANRDECLVYVELLKQNGRNTIVQEYISLDEGEFTIGVLSLPNKEVIGCVVMKRIFNSKLSIAYKSKFGLISSGYSQGLIGDFPLLKEEAINIARAISSCGPLNIQGRVRNGKLIVFEINPRFSASTYLRAKAGFNEIDCYLEYLINKTKEFKYELNYGYYLRSFEELFVPLKNKNDSLD